MELFNVVSDSIPILESVAQVPLFARGHKTTEALSQPLVWFSYEGYSAHYYLADSRKHQADGGKPAVPSPDSCIVFLNFEDALRDCFRRRYRMVIEGRLVWDASLLWHEHELLNMASLEPARTHDDLTQKAEKRVAAGVEHACRRFKDLYNVIKKY
jgi:hypothetical protein